MSTSKVKIQVLFFAKARELLRSSESEIQVHPSISVQGLYQILEETWSDLAKLNRSFALALNEEYLSLEQTNLNLSTGDVLAVIPPISGG